jgi:hypothetical protein
MVGRAGGWLHCQPVAWFPKGKRRPIKRLDEIEVDVGQGETLVLIRGSFVGSWPAKFRKAPYRSRKERQSEHQDAAVTWLP